MIMPPDSRTENANLLIEKQLTDKLFAIGETLKADMLTVVAPIYYGVDDEIRIGIDSLGNQRKRKSKLAVIIETGGGYIEVAERIVNTFRQHYKTVEFIIPDSAMSAGTVIVLSGDVIRMDYYSMLGPIDPQVRDARGIMVPALGYLIAYDELVKKSDAGVLTSAELNYLVERFDPAALFSYKQARELTVKLLEEWLVKYKFKNWRVTRSSKKRVTPTMRKTRATEIAEKLNDPGYWCSHGRGISMDVLVNDLNLVIDDFGKDKALGEQISSYDRLLRDYRRRIGVDALVHTPEIFKRM